MLLALIAFIGQPGHAFDLQRVHENVAQEFSACAAFYQFVSDAPNVTTETKQACQKAADNLYSMAVSLTSADATDAKIIAEKKSIKAAIGGDWKNIGKLNKIYGYPCKEIAENPNAAILKFVEKEKKASAPKK